MVAEGLKIVVLYVFDESKDALKPKGVLKFSDYFPQVRGKLEEAFVLFQRQTQFW